MSTPLIASAANGNRGNPGLAALTHPLALAAAAALLLNDFVFQRWWPGWWTGKLSDAAALVLAPLVLAGLLGGARPLRRLAPRARLLLAGGLVAAAFALAKAVPAVNAALLGLAGSLGLGLKLRLDPTDLLALPAVGLAVWIGQHAPAAPRRPLRAAALGLATLALLADSAAPIDAGIQCLTRTGATVLAVREMFQNSESPFSDSTLKSLYRSDDAGRTWQRDSQTDVKKLVCAASPAWPLADPGHPQQQLFYIAGQGIYHSADQGKNLQLEQAFQAVPDYELDAASQTLIVAAGAEGIWVKTADGVWQQTLNFKPSTPASPRPTTVRPVPTLVGPQLTGTP